MPDSAVLPGIQYLHFIDRARNCVGSVTNDMEIDLGRANIAVSQQGLHQFDIVTGLNKPGCERVPKSVATRFPAKVTRPDRVFHRALYR